MGRRIGVRESTAASPAMNGDDVASFSSPPLLKLPAHTKKLTNRIRALQWCARKNRTLPRCSRWMSPQGLARQMLIFSPSTKSWLCFQSAQRHDLLRANITPTEDKGRSATMGALALIFIGLVAHDCGYPLSRYTCRATRVAADFLDFIAFCRCSTGVALHLLKFWCRTSPPPVPGGVAPKFGSEKVSRYTGVSQLQLRVSRYTVQLSRLSSSSGNPKSGSSQGVVHAKQISTAQPRLCDHGQLGAEKEHKLFCTNFWNTPRGPGHPSKIFGIAWVPSLEIQGKQTFEEGNELFNLHPFAWKPPTPPGNIWAQKS